MKNRILTIIKRAAAVFLTAACIFCLYLPLPKKLSADELYTCVWADGRVTQENYSAAFESLAGMDEESVLLLRNGVYGKIESKAKEIYRVLENGNLGELLSCNYSGARIDGAALFMTYRNRVWYNGEYYAWTGEKIEKTSHKTWREVVVLEGNITSRILGETGAEEICLRANAGVKANTFVKSNVKTVRAEAPYSAEGGAIYLDTLSGKRLLAALPAVKELTLDSDLKFADEGALLACEQITALTLPFLGSALSPYGTAYRGELAHLFSDASGYHVPPSLARVEVAGGRIVAFAFYGCSNLKEINVCKVKESEISQTAFLGLNALEVLHTPQRDVLLTGEFDLETAPCGCTVFTRKKGV